MTPQSNIAMEQIPTLSQALMSDDPQAQFNATQQFRKLLSIEQNPPISEAILSSLAVKMKSLRLIIRLNYIRLNY